MRKALVIKFLIGNYLLSDLENKNQIIAYVSGKLQNDHLQNKDKKIFKSSLIKIGDIVYYEKSEDKYLIKQIETRQNELMRPNISNVDQIVLLFAVTKPKFQLRFLDKFLLILNKHHLKIILIFTKIDLLTPPKLMEIKNQISYYQQFYNIYYVNNKQIDGTKHLKDIFANHITVLGGQTGVGKSTFLNSLQPSLRLKTQEISKKLNIGRHTTKNAQLYYFNNGYIADTPGFSKLDLTIFDHKEIKLFYPDFLKYTDNCYFKNNCNHMHEIICGIKQAVKDRCIMASRYSNYVVFFQNIKNQKNKYYEKN